MSLPASEARLGQPVGDPLTLPPLHWRHRIFHLAAFGLGLAAAWSSFGRWLAEPRVLRDHPDEVLFILPFLLLGAYGGLNLYREWTRRWKPTLYERGIALRRGNRLKTFLFDEVRESAIEERQLLVNGDFYAIQRDVELRSDTDHAVFRLRALEGHLDHPGELVEQIRAGLAEAASRRLCEGEALAGAGWRLTAATFRAGSQEVPFDTVAGAGLVGGGRVGVWRVGEEKPFFTVPPGSTNATVLHDVLDERLPTHALGLGRFLFEKRARTLPAFLLGAAAAGSFACAVWLLSKAYGQTGSAVSGVLGLGAAAAGYLTAANGFRCYEYGVVKFSPLGERELRFSEMKEVSYWASPLYYKSLYIGTTFHMTFHRREGGAPLEVRSYSRRASDPDLDRLHARLTSQTAEERD